MRKAAAVLGLAVALTVTPALAAEEGATLYENGTCIEADGTQGLTGIDGECVTPSDYDILFGHDNLAATTNPLTGNSIADDYNITDDDVAASERPREFQGVPLPTFYESVEIWHRVANGWIIE